MEHSTLIMKKNKEINDLSQVCEALIDGCIDRLGIADTVKILVDADIPLELIEAFGFDETDIPE